MRHTSPWIVIVFCVWPLGCVPTSSSDDTPALDRTQDHHSDTVTPTPVEQLPPDPCSPPQGMTHNPRSIDEAVAWINAMELPVDLPCFVASLHRPLILNATSSRVSLQPSGGARSPRIFLLDDPLIMSITLAGEARVLLEFGELVNTRDSIKAEIAFPVTAPLAPDAPYNRLMYNADRTSCSLCHAAEEELPDTVGRGRVFVSRALRPVDTEWVELDAVRAEHASCDPVQEAERCALLEAMFEHGHVYQGAFPEEMRTIFNQRR